MSSKHINKNKQAATADDLRLAYMHKIGLTGKTSADLQAPDVSEFATRGQNDFEVIGDAIPPGFEFYRAVDEMSIQKAAEMGYTQIPSGSGIRFRGCHTENEVMMIRTVEAGDAYRRSEHSRREALRSGVKRNSKSLEGGAVYNETTDRTPLSVQTMER